MKNRRNLKRPLLYLLVGSVILGAVLGIILVLRNKWGWFEVRVILTTIIVSVASLCGLACDLSRTPRGANLLPRGGLLLTLVAAGLNLFGMWSDLLSVEYWKTTGSVSVFAAATVHVCLLSIARLASRFRWVYFVTCQVVYGLAVLLTVMIVWESANEGMFRFLVTVSIVDAALTLVIPLLHRISNADVDLAGTSTPLKERNTDAIDREIVALRRRILELESLRTEIAEDESGRV